MKPLEKLKKIFLGIACAVLIAVGPLAHADLIDWSFVDVTFDDGGALSGTFQTDSSTGYLVSYDFTTTAGSKLGGYHYNSGTSSILFSYQGMNLSPAGSGAGFVVKGSALTNYPYVTFTFASKLNVIGDIQFYDTTVPQRSYECQNCNPQRFLASGYVTSVTPVPEPEIYAMLGVGLGFMGWVARRQKRLVA